MKDRDVVIAAVLLWLLWPKPQASIDYRIDWSPDAPPEFQQLPPPSSDPGAAGAGGGTVWTDPGLDWWEQQEFLT